MTGVPALDRDDWGVVAGGVAAFVCAWLPWYVTRDDRVSLPGWSLGALAVIAVLLSMYAAARVLYLRGRPPKAEVPVTPQAETFVASALALALMAYRVVDAPTFGGQPAVRTIGIVLAGLAVLVQTVCAARKLGRTGVRAT